MSNYNSPFAAPDSQGVYMSSPPEAARQQLAVQPSYVHSGTPPYMNGNGAQAPYSNGNEYPGMNGNGFQAPYSNGHEYAGNGSAAPPIDGNGLHLNLDPALNGNGSHMKDLTPRPFTPLGYDNGSAPLNPKTSEPPTVRNSVSEMHETTVEVKDPSKPEKWESQGCFRDTLHYMDAYKVEEKTSTHLGAFITFAIMPASTVYAIILLIQLLHAPNPMQNEIIWSNMGGPFPMKMKCVAEGGCRVSNHHETTHQNDCWSLNKDEILDLEVSYSFDPNHGISVLASSQNAGKPIVQVQSESYMPMMPAADEDGTFLMWQAARAGMTLYNFVHTQNNTLSNSGRTRREWFGSWVDRDGAVQDGTTPCSIDDPANYIQARLRMNASWNHLVVNAGFSFMAWLSMSCGWYAAMISWGALLIWLREMYIEWLYDHSK